MEFIKIESLEDVPQNVELLLFDAANDRRVIGVYKKIEAIQTNGFDIFCDSWALDWENEDEIKQYQEKLKITHYSILPGNPQ